MAEVLGSLSQEPSSLPEWHGRKRVNDRTLRSVSALLKQCV